MFEDEPPSDARPPAARPEGSMTVKERPRLAVHEQPEVKEALKRLRAREGRKIEARVVRLARHGEVHSDPEIAALALQWARATLSAEPRYAGKSLFLYALADIFTGGLSTAGSRAQRERVSLRTAEQIVRAHEAMTPLQ